MATKAIEIIHKETIKPSSPTPQSLKIHNLSLQDQFTPRTYTSLILFYPANAGGPNDRHRKSEKLKTSLSETLTKFYPLAGRLRDNSFIDCNDEGAEFIEAKIQCCLSEFLEKPDPKSLNQFLPEATGSPASATGNLLLVQATFFDCGGITIGVCVTHKIADAATLTTFIKCWSTIATNSGVVVPVFMADSIYPSQNIPMLTDSLEFAAKKCVTKRLVFDSSKIAVLREKLASETVQKPTRVEAVSGLIWKGIIKTLEKLNSNSLKPSILVISVNLRPRVNPPLQEHYAGNFVGLIFPGFDRGCEAEVELKSLVGKIRKEIEEFGEKYVKKIQGENGILELCGFAQKYGEMLMNKEINFYICTSWCKFDLYSGDFGFGKPIWVSHVSLNHGNIVLLMDARDGDGIEAWLTLSEDEMSLFECDEELLEFGKVNPSVKFN